MSKYSDALEKKWAVREKIYIDIRTSYHEITTVPISWVDLIAMDGTVSLVRQMVTSEMEHRINAIIW